jgi:hypothetical protein
MARRISALGGALGAILIALPQLCAAQPSDQTLVIKPQVSAPQAPSAPAPPASAPNRAAPLPSDEAQHNDVNLYLNNESPDAAYQPYFQPVRPSQPAMPTGPLPYLGVGVHPYELDYTGGQIHGLEVISVDAGSPAAAAGLRPATNPTSLGASGATAGALLGPAEFIMMPLLKKTGQLGKTGDLIVAVDDKRVSSEQDLAEQLARLKAGDTAWLTVIRDTTKIIGKPKSVQIGVRLGPAHQVAASGTE